MAAAVLGLSPVSITRSSPFPQRGERLGRPGLHRVGQGQGPAGLAVPGGEHDGVARRLEVLGDGGDGGRDGHALGQKEERPPDQDRPPVDEGSDAVAGNRAEVGRLGAVQSAPRWAAPATMARPMGCSEPASAAATTPSSRPR